MGRPAPQSYEQIKGEKWLFLSLRIGASFKFSSKTCSTQPSSRRDYLIYLYCSAGVRLSAKCMKEELFDSRNFLNLIFRQNSKIIFPTFFVYIISFCYVIYDQICLPQWTHATLRTHDESNSVQAIIGVTVL